jgi:hypothetical protein
MPLSTYTELKAAVADVANRTDLTNQIIDSITLAEMEMQVDCKIMELESDASITITSGSGPLPTEFLGMRSCYWDGDTKTPLKYITPDGFDSLRNNSGDTPAYYTISGTTIRVNEGASGTLKAMCNVRFTPLSGSQASNDILAYFPNAYLYGALKHLAIVTEDDAKVQKFGMIFEAEKQRIKANNKDRKYAGPLQVRPR